MSLIVLVSGYAGSGKDTFGSIAAKEWYQMGKNHREDAPAVITYYENGKVMEEKWYYKGLLHNVKGPAITKYEENGTIKHKEYWYMGRKTDEETIKKYQKMENCTEKTAPQL